MTVADPVSIGADRPLIASAVNAVAATARMMKSPAPGTPGANVQNKRLTKVPDQRTDVRDRHEAQDE